MTSTQTTSTTRRVRLRGVYEEVALSRMKFEDGFFTYECPCGDLFEITLEELREGETIAACPSCTLKIRVLFETSELAAYA